MNVNRMHDDTKLIYHMDRVMGWFDHGKPVAPIHVDMGIAKFCNVSCCFCYGKFQNVQKVFIEKSALIQTVKDAKDIGIKSLAFIGDGEPTCNPHLYEAVDTAISIGIDLSMSSNGVLIDSEDKCKQILAGCKWMRFCFSAGTREGYKKIHGKDYYDRVVENIQRMVETKKKYGYGCDIGMQAVFVPTLMKEEMIEESKLAIRLGVDYFVIKQCALPDSGESGMEQFDLGEYDKAETDVALKLCEDLSTDNTDIIVKWNIIKQKGQRPYRGCPSVPFISEISGNGDWFPCGHMFGGKSEFVDYKFGNLHEISLKEMFYSEKYWKIITKMRDDFDVQNQCRGACRLDMTNAFCWKYMNKPSGINFI